MKEGGDERAKKKMFTTQPAMCFRFELSVFVGVERRRCHRSRRRSVPEHRRSAAPRRHNVYDDEAPPMYTFTV